MIRKIITSFVGLVAASLVFGLNSAYDGKNLPIKQEITETKNEEVLEVEESTNEIKEEISEKESEIEELVEETQSEQVFSDSNTETISQTQNQVKVQDIEQTSPVVNTEPVINNQSSNNESTDFYNSITHGKTDESSESACYNLGRAIQQAELNDVLDWNEANLDNQKQPIINYTRCYPVIKDNVKLWYLHFFTTQGEGMDDYLKEKYKPFTT